MASYTPLPLFHRGDIDSELEDHSQPNVAAVEDAVITTHSVGFSSKEPFDRSTFEQAPAQETKISSDEHAAGCHQKAGTSATTLTEAEEAYPCSSRVSSELCPTVSLSEFPAPPSRSQNQVRHGPVCLALMLADRQAANIAACEHKISSANSTRSFI